MVNCSCRSLFLWLWALRRCFRVAESWCLTICWKRCRRVKKTIIVFAPRYERRKKREFAFPTRNQIPDFRISRPDALRQRLSRVNKLSTSFIDYAKRVLQSVRVSKVESVKQRNRIKNMVNMSPVNRQSLVRRPKKAPFYMIRQLKIMECVTWRPLA